MANFVAIIIVLTIASVVVVCGVGLMVDIAENMSKIADSMALLVLQK